jgi:radical SAM protein with 4Fe4S-binding SPASM domain
MSSSSIKAHLNSAVRNARILALDQRAREIYRNNFLKEYSYVRGLTKSLGKPKIYQLETTNYCPYTCVMCPRTHAMTRELGHMDIGLFRTIVDQINPAWQADNVLDEPSIALWHFGEPIVYRHFNESISYSHSKGLEVALSTNPSVWTKQRIREMLELPVDHLNVMFDGMNDETSMAIRGKAASFQRGHANLMELLAEKNRRGCSRPNIWVSMVRQPKNGHQWQTFQNYWKNVDGVDSVSLGSFSTFAGDVPELVTINEELSSYDTVQRQRLACHAQCSRLACYYPWHSFAVTWEGKAVPCCRDHNSSLVLGDLRNESIEQVWNGQPLQELRRQFVAKQVTARPCSTCRERSAELVLPGRYYPFTAINLKRANAYLQGSRFP